MNSVLSVPGFGDQESEVFSSGTPMGQLLTNGNIVAGFFTKSVKVVILKTYAITLSGSILRKKENEWLTLKKKLLSFVSCAVDNQDEYLEWNIG